LVIDLGSVGCVWVGPTVVAVRASVAAVRIHQTVRFVGATCSIGIVEAPRVVRAVLSEYARRHEQARCRDGSEDKSHGLKTEGLFASGLVFVF
jgi:hypothetical protein